METNENRLLRLRQVLDLIPVSRSTWYVWIKAGKAPSPIKLGEKTSCWKYSDVINFIEREGV